MPILYESTDIIFRAPTVLAPQNLQTLNNMYMLKHSLATYQDALAEAQRIEAAERIPMTVESLKPVHLGWPRYGVIPVGDCMTTLRNNTAFMPVGVWSIDEDFSAVKWYSGAKTRYLFDWLTAFVYMREEKQQVMMPQPVFKGAETFTMTIVSSDPGRVNLHAWIIAYVVLPETMVEQPIYQ